MKDDDQQAPAETPRQAIDAELADFERIVDWMRRHGVRSFSNGANGAFSLELDAKD